MTRPGFIRGFSGMKPRNGFGIHPHHQHHHNWQQPTYIYSTPQLPLAPIYLPPEPVADDTTDSVDSLISQLIAAKPKASNASKAPAADKKKTLVGHVQDAFKSWWKQ